MKNLILLVVAMLCLSACSTDLTDIEKRIEEIERQGKELEDANKKLQEESQKLKEQGEALSEEARRRQEENEKIQKRLQELGDSLNMVEPKLLSMEFVAADNPLQLIENTPCTIIGDSLVECRIQNVTNDKLLIPRFTFQGTVVTIDGVEAESGVTQFDFSSPVVLSVITAKDIKDYEVCVNSYTGLPTVWIDTNSHVNVARPNQYYGGYIKVVNSLSTGGGGLTKANVKIRGLGTIEWYLPDYITSNSTSMLPGKNAYALSFGIRTSLLNDPKGLTWGLLPNKDDLTFLHNQTAFYLGRISNLDYTPRAHYVEMFLNSRYFGTYLMEERLEISENRVNVGDDGFILNVGSDEGGTSFYTNYLDSAVTIVAPGTPSSESLSYISSFVATAENTLFSSDFTNESTGWQKYIDMDSFVDWYLINEIAKNQDGAFKANCVMNLQRGGKLKMGPLWDFEKAFDNNSSIDPFGFVVKDAAWFARLFQDPAFVARVKERFDYFYGHQQDIVSEINANAKYLKYAVEENDNRWDTFAPYTSSTVNTWAAYGLMVNSMKSWLVSRMNWLKGEFDAMA